MNQIGPDTELLSPTEAAFVAQAVQKVAANEAQKAIARQLGAHREYVWQVYDPDMDTTTTPLVIPTYNVTLACEPVDFVVTFGKDATTGASYAPVSTASFDVLASSDSGATWTAITSSPTTVAAGSLRGVGAAFDVTELAAGDMVWMRMNSGGGGKGIIGHLRIRRVREHSRRDVR